MRGIGRGAPKTGNRGTKAAKLATNQNQLEHVDHEGHGKGAA